MRMRSVQEMLVQPGWNEVLPCDASVHRLYEALDTGLLDIPVDLVRETGQRFTSLAELMAIPAHQHCPILVDASIRMVNANHLKQGHGDPCHQAVLNILGAIMLFSTIFHRRTGGLNLQGRRMLNTSSNDLQSLHPDRDSLKMAIGLDGTQKLMARRHLLMDASLEYLPDLNDLLDLKLPWELDACSALLFPEPEATGPILPQALKAAGQTGSDSRERSECRDSPDTSLGWQHSHRADRAFSELDHLQDAQSDEAPASISLSSPRAELFKHAKRRRGLDDVQVDGTKRANATAARLKLFHMHRKHVSSLRELELNRLLDTLRQPPGTGFKFGPHPINALHSINEARKLPGYGRASQADQLRMRSVKEMLVNPGWNAVLPCDASVHGLYEALDTGALDIPVDVVKGTGQRFTSLAELTAIPAHQQGPILVDAIMRMVNANHFKLANGDAYHMAVLKNMGAVLLFSTAFHQLGGGLDLQGTSMLNSLSSDLSLTRPDANTLKKSIGLDATQKRVARHIWKETSAVLARLEQERGELKPP
ncbi:hypothetical protein WJX84_008662 [Apatococcus fuscideae]|uniref:Uncharacterized protein n=1 Tax=Apatococcus fuscideae TaxID=2026836 RepID=A0AAW1ST01_9CHLO